MAFKLPNKNLPRDSVFRRKFTMNSFDSKLKISNKWNYNSFFVRRTFGLACCRSRMLQMNYSLIIIIFVVHLCKMPNRARKFYLLFAIGVQSAPSSCSMSYMQITLLIKHCPSGLWMQWTPQNVFFVVACLSRSWRSDTSDRPIWLIYLFVVGNEMVRRAPRYHTNDDRSKFSSKQISRLSFIPTFLSMGVWMYAGVGTNSKCANTHTQDESSCVGKYAWLVFAITE